MRVLANTLSAETTTWDDPGVYPSGAGAGPLPSYRYIEHIHGYVAVELTPDELTGYLDAREDHCLTEWVNEVAHVTVDDVEGVVWAEMSLEAHGDNTQVLLKVDDFTGGVLED